MKYKLKQPTKYTHQTLQNGPNQQYSNEGQDQYQQNHPKTKLIQKQTQSKSINNKKKIINKKNQPSAIRLQKINETFDNLYENASKMLDQIQVDNQNLNKLVQQIQKTKCQCQKNVKYYCLKCMTKCTSLDFPKVQLPLHLNILHHQSEKLNKSSALPLNFLTNESSIHFFSSNQGSQTVNEKLWNQLPIPSQNTFILFPHKESTLVSDQNNQKIKNILILDCTWFQTDQLIQSLSKKGYKNYLRIENYKSVYWRYNHHSDSALSSAEAITFFMRDYQKIKQKLDQGEQKQSNIKKYDNLLFLYCLNMKMVLKQQQNRRNGIKTISQNP